MPAAIHRRSEGWKRFGKEAETSGRATIVGNVALVTRQSAAELEASEEIQLGHTETGRERIVIVG